MALFQCNFYSDILNLCVSMDVILPQPAPGTRLGGRNYPVLWLLHGMSDDHTAWQRRTSIERYVEPLELAVVMPAVDRSFYTDMVHGNRYWSYMTDELPLMARNFFPLSVRREDNFVAGLSMGGYGAFKLAFSYPGRFAAAASLSGALIDFSQAPVESPDPDSTAELENIFGDLSEFSGSHHDLYALSRRLARNQRENAPLLFQCCGTEDHLYQDNLRFKAHIEQLGLSFTYREGPGEHEWGYWDHMIQEVLTWLPLKSAAS